MGCAPNPGRTRTVGACAPVQDTHGRTPRGTPGGDRCPGQAAHCRTVVAYRRWLWLRSDLAATCAGA
eukprot:6516538-Alexandrium_andersonii.AAC.1